MLHTDTEHICDKMVCDVNTKRLIYFILLYVFGLLNSYIIRNLTLYTHRTYEYKYIAEMALSLSFFRLLCGWCYV